MFDEIKATLHDFGVDFDVYFHENNLHESGAVDRAIKRLTEMGNTYEKDGALWIRTEKYGDDKDRVIIKSDGEGAYISGDAAYYVDKKERGFDRCLIMLGADHHGYVGRLMALCAAFGDEPGKDLEVLIGQMVNLLSNGQPLRMSKRAGTVITLEDLVEAIGVDAARYALARYTSDTTIDIDLDAVGQAEQRQPGLLRAVRPRPARLDPAQRRRPRARARGRRRVRPLAAGAREGGRPAAGPRGVPAGRRGRRPAARAAPGGALPRGHRGRRSTGSTTPAGCCRWATRSPRRSTRPGCCWSTRPGPCSPTACACSGSPPPSGCDDARAHEAGWAHAEGRPRPAWLRRRTDVNDLVPLLWSSTARKNDDGALEVGGVDLRDLVAEHGSPAYVLDEADFRARARAFREAFGGYDVFYAGKAFLCTTVARWVAEEGLCLDVCSAGELTVALRAGFDPARIGYHGNNKTTDELRRAVTAGVGRIVVDSFHEIERLAAVTAELGSTARVMVRVTAGVEAHTHEYIATAHEDQKFGFSITSGDALDAVRRVQEAPGLELLRAALAHRVADLRHLGLRGRGPAGAGAARAGVRRARRDDARAGPRRRLRHRLHHPGRPGRPRAAGHRADQDRRARVPRSECAGAARSRSSPAARSSAPRCARSTRSARSRRSASTRARSRTYVSVDGGMSDNIRTALYDADYSCTLASRRSDAEPVLGRVVGKHCEAGDIVVKDEFVPGDLAPGDLLAVPGTGAYCRSMASNYNHALRPPVVAVRDGASAVVVRRETEDDLLRTDVGA